MFCTSHHITSHQEAKTAVVLKRECEGLLGPTNPVVFGLG